MSYSRKDENRSAANSGRRPNTVEGRMDADFRNASRAQGRDPDTGQHYTYGNSSNDYEPPQELGLVGTLLMIMFVPALAIGAIYLPFYLVTLM